MANEIAAASHIPEMGAFRWGQEHDMEYLSSAMSVFLLSNPLADTLNNWTEPSFPRFFFQRIRRKSQQVGLGP